MAWTRRGFLGGAGRVAASVMAAACWGGRKAYATVAEKGVSGESNVMLRSSMATENPEVTVSAVDHERMKALAAWTAETLKTDSPVPFGAEIFHSTTGVSLMRALNDVAGEKDPSSHAEVRTIRLACQKIGSPSLAGYTLYTTCEPCPMCMSDALWAGLDRVVYGATIADANRFVKQIRIPATEVAKRSDMVCVVDGPVEQAACLAIFEHPKMQEVFKRWTSKK